MIGKDEHKVTGIIDSFTDEWGDGFGVETIAYMLYSGSSVVYVGHTRDLPQRLTNHRYQSPWFRDITAVTAAVYSSRTAAQVAERWLIHGLQPKYNRRSRRGAWPTQRCPDPVRPVDTSGLL